MIDRDAIIEEQTEKIEELEAEVDHKESKICRLQMQLLLSNQNADGMRLAGRQEDENNNSAGEDEEEADSELCEQEKIRIFEEYLN